jgi:hypothetical protein
LVISVRRATERLNGENMIRRKSKLLKWLASKRFKNGPGVITEARFDQFLRDVYSQPSALATCCKIEIDFLAEGYGPVRFLDKKGNVLGWSSLDSLYQYLKMGLEPKKSPIVG